MSQIDYSFMARCIRTIVATLILAWTLAAATSAVLAQPQSDVGEEPFPYHEYEAMPLPIVERVDGSNDQEVGAAAVRSDFVGYDMRLGQEFTPTVALILAAEVGSMERSAADQRGIDAVVDEESIDGFSELKLISSPSQYPWQVNVKLYIDFPDGTKGECSGVLIDPMWVLTAGHCVSYLKHSGWAQSIRAIPAYDNKTSPFGHAQATRIFSVAAWSADEEWEWDMGFIRLDWPIGAMTGWHNYSFNKDDDFFYDHWFFNPGYPAEPPYDGEEMYYWEGKYDDVTGRILYLDSVSYRGQSGSGSYAKNSQDDGRTVYAVASHLTPNGTTGQTRLMEDWFDYIGKSVQSHTPVQYDLMPMTVSSTQSVTAGEAIGEVEFILHNYSQYGWRGQVGVDLYLSPDREITSSDWFIGHVDEPVVIPAKGTRTITVDSTSPLPADISGNYWVGVIVTNNDHNVENNRSSARHSAPILVQQAALATPEIILVEAGQDRISLAWTKIPRAVRYSMVRSVAGEDEPEKEIALTLATTYVDTPPRYGVPYAYRVRAEAASGQWSEYSLAATEALPSFKLYLPLNPSN